MRFRLLPVILILITLAIGARTYTILDKIDHKRSQLSGVGSTFSKVNNIIHEAKAETKADKEDEKSEKLRTGNADKRDASGDQGFHLNTNPKSVCRGINLLDPSKDDFNYFTDEEVSLLKELSQRREDIERMNQEVETKQKLLKATEAKIDQKIDELKALQNKVESILAQYNEKENSKINSLVKIYERMKPKDAAQIFDQMDMSILLQVIGKMKESNVALILANMNPDKARQVSTEFLNKDKDIPAIAPQQ